MAARTLAGGGVGGEDPGIRHRAGGGRRAADPFGAAWRSGRRFVRRGGAIRLVYPGTRMRPILVYPAIQLVYPGSILVYLGAGARACEASSSTRPSSTPLLLGDLQSAAASCNVWVVNR